MVFNKMPEITVQALAERRAAGGDYAILDVREPLELTMASLGNDDVVHVPMSELANRQLDALPATLRDQHAEIYVLCHHGSRSAQVTAWLQRQGWTNVHNIRGGIDDYAKQVDASVGKY